MVAVIMVLCGIAMVIASGVCMTFMDVSDLIPSIGVVLLRLGVVAVIVGVIWALFIASGIHVSISS